MDQAKQKIAWGVASGEPIPEFDKWPDPLASSPNISPDGRWQAFKSKRLVKLIDTDFKHSAREKAHRKSKAEFNPIWHQAIAGYVEEFSKDWFQALFHRAAVLNHDPTSNQAHWRMRMVLSKLESEQPELLDRLPPYLNKAISIPEPPINETYAHQLNNTIIEIVKDPNEDPITEVTMGDLQRICEQYPRGRFFHTLGIAQYRAGDYESAIDTLTTSLLTMPIDFNLKGPHPADLAFYAMCLHKLGQHEAAIEFQRELEAGSPTERSVISTPWRPFLERSQSGAGGRCGRVKSYCRRSR